MPGEDFAFEQAEKPCISLCLLSSFSFWLAQCRRDNSLPLVVL